jgi:hypothetical protein
MVRIRLPPVESLLAGFRPLTSKSRAFPAGVRGGGDVIAYSARGSFRSTDINLTMRV